MGMITAYHPVTRLTAEVPEESMAHLRNAGWMTPAEHAEWETAKTERAEAAAKDDAAAARAAAKGAGKGANDTGQEK